MSQSKLRGCHFAILPFCQAVTLYRIDPGDQSIVEPQWKEEHSIEKGASVCQLLIKLNIIARIADQTYERHRVMFLGKSWIFSSKKITSGWVGTRSRVVWTDRREIPSHHLGTRSCRDIVGAFQRYSKILSVHFKGSDQDLSTGSHTQMNSNVSVHTTVSFHF